MEKKKKGKKWHMLKKTFKLILTEKLTYFVSTCLLSTVIVIFGKSLSRNT